MEGILAITFIFGGPVIYMILNHHKKIMEMKLQMHERADQNIVDEIRALKQQMSELRDTTTRYDMSFDAALQRLESRVGHLEQRAIAPPVEPVEAARLPNSK